MATKDGFDSDDPLPLFLSADAPKPSSGSNRAVISLRFVMASILVATATAIGISILSVRNPVTLFAEVTASVDSSGPQPSTDESMPSIQSAVIQSTVDAEAPQTAKDVPISEISASEPASQTRAENSETSEALFREFQAWNAKRDLAKPAQDDPAPVAENAPASVGPMQKHRRARTMRNARADIIQHMQKRRANIPGQDEGAHARPVQDARAQTQPGQYAEPPSFLERINPFGANLLQR